MPTIVPCGITGWGIDPRFRLAPFRGVACSLAGSWWRDRPSKLRYFDQTQQWQSSKLVPGAVILGVGCRTP